MQTRVYNFGAGPATLPESVLKEAQAELLNWQNTGCSVMEVSHRSEEFIALMQHAESTLRDLLNIPDNYHVLFLGGAARTQFAMIPMNLLDTKAQAAYLISGIWSSMAFEEASRLKQAYCLSTSAPNHFRSLPEFDVKAIHADTAYLYYTPNETVNGIRFPVVPQSSSLPLIADMTSCLLSEPIQISDFGLIFAGAQKNIGPAGLTIVIIRDDLLKKSPDPVIPTMLDYRTHVTNTSLYATPPTFNCYMASKMFDWLKQQGGIEAIYAINKLKAEKLYQAIDESSLYECHVDSQARSIVNVCFNLRQSERKMEFIHRAEQRGLYGLRGHRAVGGLRASIYNAMPMAGVDALITFMRDFAR